MSFSPTSFIKPLWEAKCSYYSLVMWDVRQVQISRPPKAIWTYVVRSVDSDLALRLLSCQFTGSTQGQANALTCVLHSRMSGACQDPLCRHKGSRERRHHSPLLSCVSSGASVLLFLKSSMMGLRASSAGEWILAEFFTLLGLCKLNPEKSKIFLRKRGLYGLHLCVRISGCICFCLSVFLPPNFWTCYLLPTPPFFFLTESKSHRSDFPTSFMEVGSWAEQTSIINVSTEGKANMGVWPLLDFRNPIEN